jgi:hypothetical protein
LHGVVAYAFRQSQIAWDMAVRFARTWFVQLQKAGVESS